MPVERGYESQVGPQSAPAPVMVNPDAYGAGIGRVMEQAGAQAHQNELRAYQIERQVKADTEAADAAHKLALSRVATDQTVLDLRSKAGPGGAGHVEAVRQALEAQYAGLTDGITEDRVREHVRAQIDNQTAAVLGQEVGWQEGQRVGKILTDHQQVVSVSSNRIRTSHDDKAYVTETQALEDYVHSMVGIDDATREKLLRQGHQAYAIANLNRMFDQGQAKTAIALINSGAFNDILDPEQLDQARRGAEVEIRRDDALQRQQSAAAIAGAKEQVATFEARASNGLENDPGTMAALRDQFSAIGDTSTAEKLNGLISDNVFARQYDGQLPMQLQKDLSLLAGKANASEADQRQAAWLRKQVGPRAEAFRADSKGYFVKYGGQQLTPPPLDITNPQSVDATVQWVRTASRTAKFPVSPLTKDEAWTLQQAATRGSSDRMSVLGMLDHFPDVERDRAAEQILPGDAGFRQEAQMRPEARAFVFEGRGKLAADKTFLKPDPKTPEGRDKIALLGVMGAELETTLNHIPVADRTAIKRTAGEWLAGWLTKHGRTVDTLSPWDIRQAATFALGGHFERNRQIGGIGSWYGDAKFVLPETMSELDFVNNVARDREFQRKDGNEPSMDLRNAKPVWIGGSHYRWETPQGRAVLGKNHADYISNVVAGR